MAADPSIVAALRGALDTQPGNVALRLHLAGVLIDDDAAGALDQCVAALAVQPDNGDALTLAARAAAAAGDGDRASRFGRMAAALGTSPADRPPGQADGRLAADAELEHEEE